jgi:hypothetical protein
MVAELLVRVCVDWAASSYSVSAALIALPLR